MCQTVIVKILKTSFDASARNSKNHCLIELKDLRFLLIPYSFTCHHTSYAYWHISRACSTVSSRPQKQHAYDAGMCLCLSCILVGKQSWAILHRIIFIFGGALIAHSRFHNLDVSSWSEDSPLPFSLKKWWRLSNLMSEYADLTVYIPDLVWGQNEKSSHEV